MQAPPAELTQNGCEERSELSTGYSQFTGSIPDKEAKHQRGHDVRAARQPEDGAPVNADAVRLAQQGDSAAFERIYRIYSRRVYALCLRMVRDRAEAEDLTQETFLQVFRKINTFRGDSAFSTWLHRIAVNIVLMRLRRKPLADTSFDAITSPEEETSQPPQEFGGPDLRLNGVVDRITLEAAINELPPGYRAMFILHGIQGYNHHEIARMFGCSTGNSKSQVHKARMRLRELLRKAIPNGRRQHRKSTTVSDAMDRLDYAFDHAHA
jgi:RNA polymerase sigma-70 factor (ECF subfamily)